jgi:hypothetical protein
MTLKFVDGTSNKKPSWIWTMVLFFSNFTGSVRYFLFPTSTSQNIAETLDENFPCNSTAWIYKLELVNGSSIFVDTEESEFNES